MLDDTWRVYLLNLLLFEWALASWDCTGYVLHYYNIWCFLWFAFWDINESSMALHHPRLICDLYAYSYWPSVSMCSWPCSQTLSKPKGDASNAQTAKRCHTDVFAVCVYVGVCVCVWQKQLLSLARENAVAPLSYIMIYHICFLINIDGAICFMVHVCFNILYYIYIAIFSIYCLHLRTISDSVYSFHAV